MAVFDSYLGPVRVPGKREGGDMGECKVTRAEVKAAFEKHTEVDATGSWCTNELDMLNELVPPPPKSEYVKAIDNLGIMDDGHRRELWNAAICQVERRLRGLGFKNVGDEIRKLRA